MLYNKSFQNKSKLYKSYVLINTFAFIIWAIVFAAIILYTMGVGVGYLEFIGIILFFIVSPLLLLIPINIILVPIYIIKRHQQNDKSDLLIQRLSALLWLITVVCLVYVLFSS